MGRDKSILIFGVGGEGHRLAQRFQENDPLATVWCFDIKYGSNHVQNRVPAFIDPQCFRYLDYSAIRTRKQLHEIPHAEEWFGPDQEDYYFRKLLTADDRAQGGVVVAKRFLARLGFIVHYRELLDLVVSAFTRLTHEQGNALLACSVMTCPPGLSQFL